MLTIRAMVEMGPWMLDHIHILPGRDERCDRCDTKIKNVWVMERLNEPKETRRIGSCCGPKLEELSKELWDLTTRPYRRSLSHLQTLARIARCERDAPALAPRDYPVGWAAAQQLKLAHVINERERRVMGRHVSQALAAWRMSFRRYDAACGRVEGEDVLDVGG